MKPYTIFSNRNPFFRQWNDDYYHQSNFSKYTETRFFTSDQIQDCVMSEFSDTQWLISHQDKALLKKDLIDAMNITDLEIELSIGFSQRYTRQLPKEAKVAFHEFQYVLNFSNWNDC